MMKQQLRRSGLRALTASGASRVLAPVLRGMGAIYMLHHIQPPAHDLARFRPNAGLTISPEYLRKVIQFTRKRGYDLVSLQEAIDRVRSGFSGRPFAAFTIDDGYLDNYEHAWPVFKEFECPFTIFVCPSIIDAVCELWWVALEKVIAMRTSVAADLAGGAHLYRTQTLREKHMAFKALYGPLRALPEVEQRRWARQFCAVHGLDMAEICRPLGMTWDQLRELAQDPLVTIGAHTDNHYAVAKLPAHQARDEMSGSRVRLQRELERRVDYLAYPYGDPASAGPRDFQLAQELGFKAAVTTRKGLIYKEHRDHLMALPRLSLNGEFQDLAALDALLSGTAFALHNRFKRLNVT